MIINAIIQCRMTSGRFPGKVLAPLMGKPIIDHVLNQIKKTKFYSSIILATSIDKADDPLAIYAEQIGLKVIRGSRNDVMQRFALALNHYSCEAFFRICGDSPLLLPHLFDHAVSVYQKKSYDIITNVFPRTYPAVMSVELFKTDTFLKVKNYFLNDDEKEHISKYYYLNFNNFQIHNIECDSQIEPKLSLAVDEIGDLKKIEKWLLNNKSDYKDLFPIKFVK